MLGSVWIDFLPTVRNESKDCACELLGHWLQIELIKYRGGVYNVTYGEPLNYDKLPDYSICRGLVDYLRRCSNSISSESDVKLHKMIFQILCVNRPKPLPPVNWEFLTPYCKHPEVQIQALTLAAKEAKGSLSARACIEKYINDEPHTVSYLIIINFLFNLLVYLLHTFISKNLYVFFHLPFN